MNQGPPDAPDDAETTSRPGFDPTRKSNFAVGFGAPAAPPADPPHRAGMPPVPAATDQPPTESLAAPEGAPPPRATLWARVVGNRILFISIILHLIFGAGATLFIVQRVQARRKLTFQGGPGTPSASTRALEHKVNMTRKQQTMSAPAQAKRITTTGLSKISMPEMPSLPSANELTPNKMGGMGGSGMGFGAPGGGGGGGGGGGKGMTILGMREGGNGLAGTFYDLKQTREGQPTDMGLQANEQGEAFFINAPVNALYDRVLGSLVSSGMSEGSLDKYFRAPQLLYINQFFVPEITADTAPKTFNVGDKAKGRRWVVVYRGKVTPPESGRYRFAGFGDDILVVRLNGQIVLDASFAPPTKAVNRETYAQGGLSYGWKTFVGKHVELSGGSSYPMEVVIGERPGGEFGAFLLVEKEGAQYAREASGAPVLPIFKLAPSATPPGGKNLPQVAADTSWSIWKSQPTKSLGF